METERGWWELGVGQGVESPCFPGTESQFRGDEKGLEMEGGCGCTSVSVLRATEVCT